jgi:thiol:disulfide interchange protein
MLVFTGLALGMASPYLLLSFSPALLRHLPRPGKWMETMKQVLAFPLYLTVVWLAWVLGRQVGVDAIARLAAGLTLIGAALWALDHWRRADVGRGGRIAATAVALLLAVGGMALAWPGDALEQPVAEEPSGPWKPWSEAAVAQARASGKVVFVDFTAAWCVTCQVNKRLVLESDAVQARLQRDDVALLRADWTNQDANITEALRSLGRIGVPVYAVYHAGSDAAPTLLPELLTRERVLQAIEDAAAAPALVTPDR